uniref:autotransporter outer membrane beta-barrel domain-containing protein n=1 Tax=Escherichia coli TaxID=562 RepID=UPI001C58FC99
SEVSISPLFRWPNSVNHFNSREKYSFKGNGWNNGVGVSAQYNKQHTFYLEADYTQGNLFDQKQVNGGYRFSF